jgi:hypothetical protein
MSKFGDLAVKKRVLSALLAAASLLTLGLATGCGDDSDPANPATAYTVTVVSNLPDGGTVTRVPDKPTYSAGEQIVLIATPLNGFDFVNWTGSVVDPNAISTSVTVNSNMTIIANFKAGNNPASYTVTVVSNLPDGGTVTRIPDKPTYSAGEVIVLTATPANGFDFVNWAGSVASPIAASTSVTVNANMTIIANFQASNNPTSYTVTVVSNLPSGGTVTRIPDKPTYSAGEVIVLTATPANGFDFVNWTGPVATPNAASTSITVNSNMAIIANFKAANGGGNPWDNQSCNSTGPCIPITNQADWNTCPTTNRFPTATCTPGNVTPTTFTLTTNASPAGAGTISRSPDAASYPAGTFVTVTVTATSNYMFRNWEGASTSSSNSIIVEMDGNKTLTANFDPRPSHYCCWPASALNNWKDECYPIGSTFATPDAAACLADHGIVQNNDTPPTGIQYCIWASGCWAITDPSGDNINELGVYTGYTNLEACQMWATLVNSATACPDYGTGGVVPPPPPPPGGDVPVGFWLRGRELISGGYRYEYRGYRIRIGTWDFSQTFTSNNYSNGIVVPDVMIPAGTYSVTIEYLRWSSLVSSPQQWLPSRSVPPTTLRPGFRYELDIVNGSINTLPLSR